MKTRIIHTTFYTDEAVDSLSKDARWLFMYCLTTPLIGLTGVFQATDKRIMYDTGLTPGELAKAKGELTNHVIFKSSWVVVKNTEKYHNFKGSKTTSVAYERELSTIPEEIKKLLYSIDRVSPNPDTVSGISDTPRSNKQEVINKKTEERESQAQFLISKFNQVFGKSFQSPRELQSNLSYWLESYTLEQILEAVDKAKYHEFWHDKLTPVVLLRRRNKNQEPVDYIGQLLNSAEKQDLKPQRMGYKALKEKYETN